MAQIHEYKGRQQIYLRQREAELDKLVEIAKVQSTEASNEIEGIRTINTRLKQLCADKTTPRNPDEKEIMGYRDVLNTIHENYEYIPLRSNYILQLHRDLYRYSEKGIGGKFKNTQNYISATDNQGNAFVLFTPLPPYETPAAYRDFDERMELVEGKRSALEVVRKAAESKLGKFTKADMMEMCPTLGKTSVESSMKKLVEEGILVQHGKGRATFYTRA